MMKKTIALVLCILSIASLTACGSNASKQDGKNREQIPNPFVNCETLDDAASISGFDMAAPDSIDGYDQRLIQAVKDEMVQVSYPNGDDSITIRKAVGTDDCSGDYNQYDETNEVEIYNLSVTFKGADGKINTALWTNNGYAYSINSTVALDKTTISDLITVVSNDINADVIGGDPATWGPTDGGDAQIPNPFVEYATMEKAATAAGFNMAAPDSIDGYDQRSITAIANEMFQVTYMSGDNSVLIRKALGAEDISGDYNQYAKTNELVMGSVTVTMKGNDGMVYVATWTNDTYSYAIDISGASLSTQTVAALVQSIG